jgi:hypothetical protein
VLGVQSLGPIAPRRIAEDAPAPGSAILPTGLPAAAQISPDAASALEREAWVVLVTVAGLGPVGFGTLLAAFGSARAVLQAAAGPVGQAGCWRPWPTPQAAFMRARVEPSSTFAPLLTTAAEPGRVD